MSETLSSSIKLQVNGSLIGTSNLGSREYDLTYSKVVQFANGTDVNQANELWTDNRTLTASSAENIDLAGVLVSPLGTSLAFTTIKAIIIYANAANTNQVLVGGAGSNTFINWVADATDIIKLHPGGFICLTAPDATGYAVTASTGDLLKIANGSSGTSVNYDIIIIGCV